MRLIDADKLMLQLNDYALQVAPFRDNDLEGLAEYNAIKECMKAIEEQPTAYDVEKVANKIHEYFEKVIYESPTDNIPLEVLEYNKAVCEIVKEGGVNE